VSDLENPPSSSSGLSLSSAVLFGAVIALLAATVYLFVQVDRVQTDLANLDKSIHKDLTTLRESSSVTTATARRNLDAMREELEATKRQAAMAVGQAKTEAIKRAEMLTAQIAEEQRRQSAQMASQISEVKEATTDAATKIGEVKTDVGGVKTDLSATKAELDKTISELKRVRGDMGEMSGLIATNGKELSALVAKGDRNYFKFDRLRKSKTPHKLGDVAIMLKKTDPRKNKFTLDVIADDKRPVEKKDKGVNEPLQFYVFSKSNLPYELVVNQVGKDEISGYLAAPKVQTGR
jgi:hypothetical protein